MIIMTFTPPIIMIFADVIVSLFVGVIYMLMAAKIPKFGIFTLSGILIGLLFLMVMGQVYMFIGSACGGILGDIIALKWGNYKNKGGLFTAYAMFRFCFALGTLIPYYLLRDIMFEQHVSLGYSSEYIEAVFNCYTIEMLFLQLGLNLISGFIGAYIGYIIRKKHFVKAGVL